MELAPYRKRKDIKSFLLECIVEPKKYESFSIQYQDYDIEMPIITIIVKHNIIESLGVNVITSKL